MGFSSISVGDLARWAFWVPLRAVLNPENPQGVRGLTSAWRLRYALSGAQKGAMEAEFRLCFGETQGLVEEAYRIGVQNHLEELLLGKLTEETWSNYMRFEGLENLEAALARGKGAIVLFPHAGNFMLMIAGLSLAGFPYTQYAARGVPPPELASANPDLMRRSPLAVAARNARERSEDALPARFVTMDTSVRHLYRCLENNELVGIALEGRIGRRFEKVEFLGRDALLNPGPYKLASFTGAALVPTLCHSPRDGVNICTFGSPILPENHSPRVLLETCLREAVEPFLRAHPADYGLWLAHCRMRAGVDDHPLFIDYARDDRWRRHIG